jgi:hypothetical protein
MWETSTFAASFHARLNVALRHIPSGEADPVPPESGGKGQLFPVGVNPAAPAALNLL